MKLLKTLYVLVIMTFAPSDILSQQPNDISHTTKCACASEGLDADLQGPISTGDISLRFSNSSVSRTIDITGFDQENALYNHTSTHEVIRFGASCSASRVLSPVIGLFYSNTLSLTDTKESLIMQLTSLITQMRSLDYVLGPVDSQTDVILLDEVMSVYECIEKITEKDYAIEQLTDTYEQAEIFFNYFEDTYRKMSALLYRLPRKYTISLDQYNDIFKSMLTLIHRYILITYGKSVR